MNASGEPDLTFVTTQDLWNEIKGRFDLALLVLYEDKTRTDSYTSIHYHGGRVPCFGLAHWAAGRMFNEPPDHQESSDE